MTLLQRYFPVIPSGITDVLSGILFSGMIIYIGWLFYTIYIRDNINFSELNLVSPLIKTNNLPPTIDEKIDLSTLSLPCIGEDCCDTGTKWDKDLLKCKENNLNN